MRWKSPEKKINPLFYPHGILSKTKQKKPKLVHHEYARVRVKVRVRVRVKFLFLLKVISSGLIFWLREFVSDQINS